MKVIVLENNRFKTLKGFCYMNARTIYVVINGSLSREEKRIVAAHELGHIVLHRNILKMAPMKDEVLYQMKTSTEYDANLFAADLLIEDQDVEQLSKDEDMSYFGLCSSLYVTPELMSFKLFSLIKRGHAYNMPLELDSKFLAKSPPMQN
jgi:Zn-dependent peptidase ImmA (M78 family)